MGRADIAKFKSLPHSGTSAGTPKPKKPKLPRTKTASAAFNVKRIGKGVNTFGRIYLKSNLKIPAPEILAYSIKVSSFIRIV